MRKFFVLLIFCACCLFPKGAQAADMAMLETQVRQLNQAVDELKLIVDTQSKEIAALRSAQRVPQPPPAGPVTAPVSAPPPPKFLEIGAVADVAVNLDTPKEDEGGADRVSVRELELVLGANVDPYSRLDATVAFTEESTAELEEAYLTRFELPFDLTARVGRFKPRIGKVIPTHRDALDTVDEPLVIQRWFGVEGMSKSGVDVKRLIDLPWPVTQEISAGLLEGGNGEDGTMFGDTRRRPTLYAHLKNYVDLTDDTGFEFGQSYITGSKDADSEFEVSVIGADATLVHHFNANQNVKLQGEAYYMNRHESAYDYEIDDPNTGDVSLVTDDLDGRLWGGYALADFRIHPQWSAGFRFDYVEIVDNPVENPDKADLGYAGYLTFYQSEFARWRVQFEHTDLATGIDDNQVMLQGTFAIGEHKHKLS